MQDRSWLCVLVLLCAACSVACQPMPEEPPSRSAPERTAPVTRASPQPQSEPERADVTQLAEVLGETPDPVEVVLVEVDAAVERDLPVLAASILTERGLPASRALLARLRAIAPQSPRGTALRDQWVSAWVARETALTGYADALGRGIVEDLTLADALRDQRRAGDAITAARVALAEAQRRIDASAEGE